MQMNFNQWQPIQKAGRSEAWLNAKATTWLKEWLMGGQVGSTAGKEFTLLRNLNNMTELLE